MVAKVSALFTVVIVVLTIPITALAQHWNEEEQEVLAFVESCWELWADEQVETFLTDCWHENVTYWPSENKTPHGQKWIKKIAPWWFDKNESSIVGIMPMRVTVFGDAAVLHYQISWGTEKDGDTKIYTGGRSDFLLKQNGAWIFVGGQEHPVETSY